MEAMGRSTGRLRGSVAALAGGIGFAGLAFGIKDAIDAGMGLQAQQVQLKAALEATGQAGGNAYNAMFSAAERLSTRGGFATEESIRGMTAFVRETHSSTEALKLNALTTNIARGSGNDYAATQQLVARAYTGQVGRLQKLLGPMIAVKSAQYGLTQAHKEEILSLSAQSKLMGKAGPMWLRQQEILLQRHV